MQKKPRKEKAQSTRRSKPTLAKLVDQCAVLVQKLVRLKAAVNAKRDGFIQCVTCKKWDHWKNMQGGHFFERNRTATKILEENIHPQCPYCNRHGMKQTGTVLEYRRYMIEMYGDGFVGDLELESKQVKKWDRGYLEEFKKDTARQIKELEEAL